MALATDTVTEAARRPVIEGRLTSHSRPGHPLSVVAVHALTGETRIFDRSSGSPWWTPWPRAAPSPASGPPRPSTAPPA